VYHIHNTKTGTDLNACNAVSELRMEERTKNERKEDGWKKEEKGKGKKCKKQGQKGEKRRSKNKF
jgi:hypothetical protein